MDTIDRFVDNIIDDDIEVDSVYFNPAISDDTETVIGKELAVVERNIAVIDDEYGVKNDDPDGEDKPTVFTAYCTFCGQTRYVQKSWEVRTQEDANNFANRECRCSMSKAYRDEKTKADRRRENIERINASIDGELAIYANAHEAELTAPIRELIYNGAAAVLDEIISEHMVSFGSKIKVKTTMNVKDNIVLTYSYSDSEKHEV
jgi:hypothetical protein